MTAYLKWLSKIILCLLCPVLAQASNVSSIVVGWGNNDSGQTASPANLTNAVAIAAGGHSMALRSDGTLAVWADNTWGRASVPVGLSNIVAFAAGYGHCLAVPTGGGVQAWGYGEFGQTNVPPSAQLGCLAVSARERYSVALLPDTKVVAWGGGLAAPSGLSNIISIAAGQGFGLALNKDGLPFSFGEV